MTRVGGQTTYNVATEDNGVNGERYFTMSSKEAPPEKGDVIVVDGEDERLVRKEDVTDETVGATVRSSAFVTDGKAHDNEDGDAATGSN